MRLTSNVWSSLYTDTEFIALTISSTPLKLFKSWKTCKISIILLNTATRSSKFSVSTMHLIKKKRSSNFGNAGTEGSQFTKALRLSFSLNKWRGQNEYHYSRYCTLFAQPWFCLKSHKDKLHGRCNCTRWIKKVKVWKTFKWRSEKKINIGGYAQKDSWCFSWNMSFTTEKRKAAYSRVLVMSHGRPIRPSVQKYTSYLYSTWSFLRCVVPLCCTCTPAA